MTIALFHMILGLSVMILCADRLVVGASSLARHWGVPPLLVGLSLVAFGTSAPEITVSIMASLANKPDIGVGNAIGSNITNIALVIGLCAIVRPLVVEKALVLQQIPLLIGVTFLTYGLLWVFGLHLATGLCLLAAGIAFILLLIRQSRTSGQEALLQAEELPSPIRLSYAWGWVLIGCTLLPLSANYFVSGATVFAHYFGFSDLFIGLTLVALGTSLPELVTSLVGTIKGEDGIAVGNIVGSNIFNLTIVMAAPALLSEGELSPWILSRDIPLMVGLTLVLGLVSYSRKRHGIITRLEGSTLLLFYIAYITLIFVQN